MDHGSVIKKKKNLTDCKVMVVVLQGRYTTIDDVEGLGLHVFTNPSEGNRGE